jgi:hypothetical protein
VRSTSQAVVLLTVIHTDTAAWSRRYGTYALLYVVLRLSSTNFARSKLSSVRVTSPREVRRPERIPVAYHQAAEEVEA